MTIGTQHKYSINDAHFTALPVSDQILKVICGSFSSEIPFGETKLGKELQKTVLEFLPRVPAGSRCARSDAYGGHQEILPHLSRPYHLWALGCIPP